MTTAPEAAHEGEAGGWVLSVPPELVESWPAGPEEGCAGLAELPPDPLAGVGCPVEEEPAWVASWLQDEAQGCDGQDERGHLPSEVLAGVEPGLFLAAELEATDLRVVDDYHLVEVIAGYQRMSAWAQHRMTELAGRLSRRPALNPSGSRPDGTYVINVAAQELAPRLGISRFAAQRMVDNAQMFRLKLEDTGAALQQGRIDSAKANTIARLLKDQPDDVAWEVQQMVLPDATHQTVTQLERAVNKAIISIDPLRATARYKLAREKRRVNHPRPLPDGMASMSAILPATDAAGLDLALEAAARTAKAAGDTRTIDQLRADALALLGHGALEHGFIGVPRANSNGDGADADASSPGNVDGVPADGNAEDPADDRAGAAPDGADGSAADRTDAAPDGADGSAADRTDAAPGDAKDADHSPASTTDCADGLRDDVTDSAEGSDAGVADGSADHSDAPVMHTGNAFLRTPHMPIGSIGGQRAQIKVTVPLSVLHPFQPPCQSERSGEGSAQDQQTVITTAANPGEPADIASPSDDDLSDDDLPDDYGLPEDWYHGAPVEVAELDGYGPITPDVARALAHSGGTWQRLVTDPLSGQLLDVGRRRYRPPAALADFVHNRDRTCVRPGCSVPAQACQLDHIVPWAFGGLTSEDNLGLMCDGDHPGKTVGAFQLHHLGSGNFQWITPTGHQYLRDHTGRVTPLRRETLRGRPYHRSTFGDEPPF